MATIQKIKNKKGVAYRVLIRNKGFKTITKTFPSKQLALQFSSKVEFSKEARINHSHKHKLFADVANMYLSCEYQGTRLNQQKSLTNFWISKFSSSNIQDISSSQIQLALESIKPNHKYATLNRYKAALSVIFSFSQKRFFVSNNPVNDIPSYKENNARTRYLSNEEKTSLLEACRHSHWNKLYLIVLIAITTGARKGELERLKWSDIDFDRGLAYVHQTKNGEPRVLPLTKQVLTEMDRVGRDAELIFNSSIKPTKPYEFRKEWIKALRRAEIDDFRFHDLRHTCASYLAQNGCSLLEIADVLGHRQVSMTARYSHLCVSHKQKLIEKYFGEI